MVKSRSLPQYRYDLAGFVGMLRQQVFSSQAKAAAYFHLHRTTIVRYERGELTPPLGYLACLVRLCIDQRTLAGQKEVKDCQQILLKEANRAIHHDYKDLPLQNWDELCAVADEYLTKRRGIDHSPVTSISPVKNQKIPDEQALASADAALKEMPEDPTIHEFRALVLFALARYQEAAAALHGLLTVAPGWDWTTMIGLYPNVDVYTQQLRALESYRDANPQKADAAFVLAYHYMTAGYEEQAADELRVVVKQQPRDRIAREILDMIAGGSAETGSTPAPPTPSTAAPIEEKRLVGTWTAGTEQEGKFQMTLTEDGEFTWTYSKDGQDQTMKGVYAVKDDGLVLEPDEGGTLVARIALPDDQRLSFRIVGSEQSDPVLEFRR